MIPNRKHDNMGIDIDCDELNASYRMLQYLYPHPSVPIPSPCRWLFELSRRESPNISLNENILGGIPHIEGTRLSVGQVLGRLYMLGSVSEVVKYYSELNLSEDQVKEAISFAQDFVELAGDPYQPYD